MITLAFDIDLNRIHAYSSAYGIICHNSKQIPFKDIESHEVVLIEVASATFYAAGHGQIHNRAKWAIFNSMIAGRIFEYCGSRKQVLVSPSSAWTCGYPEDIRQSIAGANGMNHDLREAKTMLFFYGTNPEKWKPFEEYFESLSTKKGKAK